MLRLRHHASLLVWLNGSDGPPPANVETAYLKVESETHWPNPVLSLSLSHAHQRHRRQRRQDAGPYDYVAPSYWHVDRNTAALLDSTRETSPGPAPPIRRSPVVRNSCPTQKHGLNPPTWSYHFWQRWTSRPSRSSTRPWKPSTPNPIQPPGMSVWLEPWSTTLERAMFEAYRRNKYTSTGVIQWMLNNAWPSMICG